MYEEFYGLSGNPFRLTPDRRFWFGSEGHRKAMSYLKYGLYQGEGFIVITGDVGTGKSTLVSQLFSELDGDDIVAAQIGTTQVDADDAIRLICAAFEIEAESTDKAVLINAFEEFLVDQNQMGRRVLLVVDEAQNLPIRTLEELRMLSNFNVGGQPLFQSFLIGQPQFLQTVAHKDLSQLQQRIIASYKLQSMSREETDEYIIHRLQTVGWNGNPEFSEEAFAAIFDEVKGVPRRINTLCNRVLLFASLESANQIDDEMVKTVIADLRKETNQAGQSARRGAQPSMGGGGGGGASLGGGGEIAPDRLARVEKAIAAIAKRVEALDGRITEHDEAIHELIDLAMTAYGGDGPAAKTDDDDQDVVQLRQA